MSRHPTTAPATILNRLLAVGLVILIAVPFTAPFQTLDLGDTPNHAGDASSAKDVALLAGVVLAPAPGPARIDVVRHFVSAPDYRVLPTVLRL